MKDFLTKHAQLIVVLAVVAVTALVPELALAQDNPILSGMKNQSVLRIAQILIYVSAATVLLGEGIPALKDQDLAKAIKIGIGVTIMVAAAVKLRDIVDLVAQIAG